MRNDLVLKMVVEQASKCSVKHLEEFVALVAFLTANIVMLYCGTSSFYACLFREIYHVKKACC